MMDPNAALAELRQYAARLRDADNYEGDSDQAADGEHIAELFQALDEWLSKGGALPDAWQTADDNSRVKPEGYDWRLVKV